MPPNVAENISTIKFVHMNLHNMIDIVRCMNRANQKHDRVIFKIGVTGQHISLKYICFKLPSVYLIMYPQDLQNDTK